MNVVKNPELGSFKIGDPQVLTLETAAYPWIDEPEIEVPTVMVELADRTAFRYGSLVGFSTALEKIANRVPDEDSLNLQTTMFRAMPYVLKGERHPAITSLKDRRKGVINLFSAGPKIDRATHLIFAREVEPRDSQVPALLKVGIHIATDYKVAMQALGIVQGAGRRRDNR